MDIYLTRIRTTKLLCYGCFLRPSVFLIDKLFRFVIEIKTHFRPLISLEISKYSRRESEFSNFYFLSILRHVTTD